ncbi:hypothetical protein AB4090_01685 [Acidithiobacillus sp. IBUN Pt1247-S3]
MSFSRRHSPAKSLTERKDAAQRYCARLQCRSIRFLGILDIQEGR